MKIVIVGGGKVGTVLAGLLSREDHDIVIIDTNQRVLEQLSNLYDVMAVTGNGATMRIQEDAGVKGADLLVAVTSDDLTNMLCCLVAKKIGARQTMARIRNPEYADQLHLMQEELGLSMVVNPEQVAASEIGRMLTFPSALQLDSFSRGRVELIEIRLLEDSPLAGRDLAWFSAKYPFKVLVGAVERQGEVVIPRGDFVMQAGDRLHLTGQHASIVSLCRKLKILKERVRDVAIVGGSRLGYYLARNLLDNGISVKLIEQREERCVELSQLLPKALIIHGDGAQHELLLEERVEQSDALIALTGMDEENIVLSLFAQNLGVSKVVTKISRPSYSPAMLDKLGLESVVTPSRLTASSILRYVRAMQNASPGSQIQTLHHIVGGQAEALEFRVARQWPYAGARLQDLNLRPHLLIAGILRKGRLIIPNGQSTIEVGDNVIIFTAGQHLKSLTDILKS